MDTETLQRLRILALSEMGHSPWLDTTKFQKSEKTKLCNLIQAKYDTLSSEEIVRDFNILITEKVLVQGTSIERLPVQIL
jgi:hypothetical protein